MILESKFNSWDVVYSKGYTDLSMNVAEYIILWVNSYDKNWFIYNIRYLRDWEQHWDVIAKHEWLLLSKVEFRKIYKNMLDEKIESLKKVIPYYEKIRNEF